MLELNMKKTLAEDWKIGRLVLYRFSKYIAYLPALLMDLCLSCALTGISFYASEQYLGISHTLLGFLGSLSTAFFVSLSIPMGTISDRIGRTRMLYAACVLTGAVNLLIPLFCRSALSLGLLFPMLGTSQALFWPVYEAWLAERSGGGQLLHRIRNFNTSWSVGIMLGPFVASRFFQWDRFVPFYFGIAVSIINLIVILSQARIRSIKSTEVQQDDISEEKLRIKRMYLHIAWAANFGMAML